MRRYEAAKEKENFRHKLANALEQRWGGAG
jgi:hypothetical protein